MDLPSNKINSWLKLNPAQFSILTHLSVEKNLQWDGKVSCDVELTLKGSASPGGGYLKVTFMNSVELQIGDLNGTVGLSIEIRDIASRQLEDIVYRVVEDETRAITLNCQDFDFVVFE